MNDTLPASGTPPAGQGVSAEVLDIPRTLVVTNDFPPRFGGVQQYVINLVRQLPPDRVAVVAPNWPGWREHDAAHPFPIHRRPTKWLWPTEDLGRRLRDLARSADVILFGHGLPLSLLGPKLSKAGIPYVVLTHGAELWMARMPGTRELLRSGLSGAREVMAVSEYTARFVRRAVPRNVSLSVLPPAVDPQRFFPKADATSIRQRLGVDERKVVLCVSRLVPRKGQDTLIAAMPLVARLVPGTVLVIAGGGPYRSRLEALARSAPPGSVRFAGEVDDEDLPAFYAACDVFAMPCRSRWGGLEVEGFGIVFLEASATGKAVVAGYSGGAEEAVVDQETGFLVEGSEPKAVALAVAKLLNHPALAERLGTTGRARVESSFTWPARAAAMAGVLRRAAARG